ncbi:MAG: RDD family protein [Actinomycetota bacterium]|nr:RDD family protein [Actinomycetota bacterium]
MKSFREFRQAHDVDDGIVLQTLPVAARALQGERAGFVTRLIAAVIDVVIVGAIMIGIWIAVWLFLLVFNPLVEYGMPRPGYFVLGGYFLMWAYWSWGWATSGRSIGQGLMGIRVLDRKGRFPSWQIAVVRSAFCVTFQVGIAWILVSRRNRSVQDVVLRTSVIHDWTSAASSDLIVSGPQESNDAPNRRAAQREAS